MLPLLTAVTAQCITYDVTCVNPDYAVVSVTQATPALSSRGGVRHTGYATWYGAAFHGRQMANGEIYDMHNAATAASTTYPLGTRVRVTHGETGKSIIVRITDRGLFWAPHLLDLSRAAFQLLDRLERGRIPIQVEVVTK